MENKEIIQSLLNLNNYEASEKEALLNLSLDLLNESNADLILYYNLNSYILDKLPNHDHYKVVEYILHNQINFSDELYKIHIVEYLFNYFKNEINLELNFYFANLMVCLENLHFNPMTNNHLKQVILNHLFDKFGVDHFSEIFTFIKKNSIPYSRNELNLVYWTNIFKDIKLSPEEVNEHVNIRELNVFLKASKDSFESNNELHQKWIEFYIERGDPVNFISSYLFLKKNPENENIKKYIYSKIDNELFKDILTKGITLKNYTIEEDSVELSKDFKEIVNNYYGTSGKNLRKQLFELCSREEGFFDFSYLYLGQIIGTKDINYIHTYLSYIKEKKIDISLVRGFIDSEIPALKKLSEYYPNNLIKYFKETKFNQFYMHVFTTKNYLDKMNHLIMEENFENFVERLNLELAHIKDVGYKLSYDDEIAQFDETSFEEFTLILPKSDKEVFLMGRYLNNCLIYPQWANNVYVKESVLIGLWSKNNTLEYVAQFDMNFNIKSMEGSDRFKASQTLINSLEQFLKSKN